MRHTGNFEKETTMKTGRYENEDLIKAKEMITEAVSYAKEIANPDLSKVSNNDDIACDIVYLLENSLKLLER